jgi:hypothetical protein
MRSIRFIAPVFIAVLLGTVATFLFSISEVRTEPVLESASSTPAPETPDVAGVRIGEDIEIAGKSVLVERVLEDSRCPRGVQCIQAGTVRVAVIVSDGESLATGTLRLLETARIGGLELVLSSVTPEPVAGFPIGTYRFTIDGQLAAPAVAADEESTSGPTGVRGIVLASPSCPVEREGQMCPPTPAGGIELRAVDLAGNEIARTKTGSDGKFLILLSPGIYTIERIDSSAFPTFAPIQVAVLEGGIRDVLIEVDSGIR